MRALVTGATGFIGGNLVRELLNQGYQVRALVRQGSDRRNIQGLDIEVAFGDLCDRPSLDRAVDGCDVLFHVAAAYTFWARDPRVIYEANVRGTENILAAARDRGIKKVVYTSSESTIGTGNNCGLATEEGEVDPDKLPGDYKKSKCLAEKLTLKACHGGLPVVVVNPTVPIGRYDVKPTPTGRLVLDFLNGRMPAYVNTGLNVVDVEDVARGHILALERGRIGERYILGNRNLTLKEILAILEKITGIKASRLRIPVWLALGAAYADEFISGRVMRRVPRVPVAGVKAARSFRYFDCSKAVRELGFVQTPVEEAFDRAVRWFQQNGYVRR
ncbi:MAG: NAD-dependent epimerase/dehydratase family protein [Chloroflexi bacterium]|nr:NAD-dependent epimerase/dehydratase family protein [Chloroflexota bacterium]